MFKFAIHVPSLSYCAARRKQKPTGVAAPDPSAAALPRFGDFSPMWIAFRRATIQELADSTM